MDQILEFKTKEEAQVAGWILAREGAIANYAPLPNGPYLWELVVIPLMADEPCPRFAIALRLTKEGQDERIAIGVQLSSEQILAKSNPVYLSEEPTSLIGSGRMFPMFRKEEWEAAHETAYRMAVQTLKKMA